MMLRVEILIKNELLNYLFFKNFIYAMSEEFSLTYNIGKH
jgi:hypothetical protein